MPKFDESLFDEIGFDEVPSAGGDAPQQRIFKTTSGQTNPRQLVGNSQTGADLFKDPSTQSGSQLFK